MTKTTAEMPAFNAFPLRSAMDRVEEQERKESTQAAESLRAAMLANGVALAISQRSGAPVAVWTDVDVRAFDALRRTLSMIAGELRSAEPFRTAPGSTLSEVTSGEGEAALGIDAVIRALDEQKKHQP